MDASRGPSHAQNCGVTHLRGVFGMLGGGCSGFVARRPYWLADLRSLKQHHWEPQRKEHRGDNHAHEADRAEGRGDLLLEVPRVQPTLILYTMAYTDA